LKTPGEAAPKYVIKAAEFTEAGHQRDVVRDHPIDDIRVAPATVSQQILTDQAIADKLAVQEL